VESLTVIVYDLYTLDNTGHGFDDVIAQNVLFTSRRYLTVDVGFKCRAIQGICSMWHSNGEISLHSAECRTLGVVLFTSRRKLPMDVVSSAKRLCFHVWLISPGVGFWFAE
jgi:hypothetical protein